MYGLLLQYILNFILNKILHKRKKFSFESWHPSLKHFAISAPISYFHVGGQHKLPIPSNRFFRKAVSGSRVPHPTLHDSTAFWFRDEVHGNQNNCPKLL